MLQRLMGTARRTGVKPFPQLMGEVGVTIEDLVAARAA